MPIVFGAWSGVPVRAREKKKTEKGERRSEEGEGSFNKRDKRGDRMKSPKRFCTRRRGGRKEKNEGKVIIK
jgi:hypothetical protein